VLTNPPNIRAEAVGRDYREKVLKKVYPGLYDKTTDLHTYFHIRAVQLLKPGGTLALVSSNRWFRAGNGAALRQYLGEHCAVRSIVDFGDLRPSPTFPSPSSRSW
jgi:hypothetical protein